MLRSTSKLRVASPVSRPTTGLATALLPVAGVTSFAMGVALTWQFPDALLRSPTVYAGTAGLTAMLLFVPPKRAAWFIAAYVVDCTCLGSALSPEIVKFIFSPVPVTPTFSSIRRTASRSDGSPPSGDGFQ